MRVAVFGCSGYVGVELVQLLLRHSQFHISHLIGESSSGLSMSEIYRHSSLKNLPKISSIKDFNPHDCDIIFSCLPHGSSAEILGKIANDFPKVSIFDLSGDFRLHDQNLHNRYYGSHRNFGLNFVYGLPELHRQKIAQSRLVSCPGCYATSIILPLAPISNLLQNVVIDSKSGISGAGKKLDNNFLFSVRNENCSPYAINSHRHEAEIIQETLLTHDDIIFTPHLIPITRGIVSTIYARTDKQSDIKKVMKSFYEGENFVEITDHIPSVKDVTGTNSCHIHIYQEGSKVVIVSVIDNLIKGSGGQAIQNANIVHGINEAEGLTNLSFIV